MNKKVFQILCYKNCRGIFAVTVFRSLGSWRANLLSVIEMKPFATASEKSVMAEGRKYDIVVFGASGFTGKHVVEEIARTASEEKGLKWAIAGRNMKSLQGVLDLVSKVTGHDLSELPIIIADVSSQDSLHSMCQQTQVVLNCVGPFRFYGTPVVEACIATGAHHIDISGETQWLEKIHLNLNKDAQDKGVFIIQACGFDSIPAEMGLLYTKKNFQGVLNSVESYISFHQGEKGGCVNDGTWRSAIHSLSTRSELRAIRERLYPQSFPVSKVKLQKRPSVFFSTDVNRWCLPFLGTDKAIVTRSSYFNFIFDKEKPVQFQPYSALSGFGDLMSWLFVGFMLMVFSKTRFGIYLLEKFPRFFSLGKFSSEGPTREQIKGSSFEMTFIGEGFSTEEVSTPDKKIITKVKGPEAGYVTTPICLVQSAYVLLKEKNNLPSSCGVLTPGRAFRNTSLIERLQKHNILFSTA